MKMFCFVDHAVAIISLKVGAKLNQSFDSKHIIPDRK